MDSGDGAVSDQDPIDPRVHESARWRAEVFDTMAKLHTKVTTIEARVGAGLGVGDDNGKFGKLADRVSTLWKGAVFAICTAIVSLGAVFALVYGRGDAAGELRTRVVTLERDVDRLSEQLRAVWSARFTPATLPGAPP
jgi:sulfite reductase beta subunit-like hemoprotein